MEFENQTIIIIASFLILIIGITIFLLVFYNDDSRPTSTTAPTSVVLSPSTGGSGSGSSPSTSGSGSGSPPSTVTAAPAAVTVAPSTVTTAPAAATVSPSTVTAAPAAVTVAPSTVTTAPSTVTAAPTTVTTSPTTVTTSSTPGVTLSPSVQGYNRLVDLLEYPRFNRTLNSDNYRESISGPVKRHSNSEFAEANAFPGVQDVSGRVDPYRLSDPNSACPNGYSPVDDEYDCNLAWLYNNTYQSNGLSQNNYMGSNPTSSPCLSSKIAPWKSDSTCDNAASGVYNTPDRGDGFHRDGIKPDFIVSDRNNYLSTPYPPNEEGYRIGGPKRKNMTNKPKCFMSSSTDVSSDYPVRRSRFNSSDTIDPTAVPSNNNNEFRLFCKRNNFEWESHI